MPSFDKKTRTWTGRVRLTDYPQSIKKGFRTRSQAARWELDEKDRLQSTANQNYSFFQVADMWLTACKQRYGEQTCSDKAFIVNRFIIFLDNDPLIQNITTIQAEDFLNDVPGQNIAGKIATGKTANRYRRELGTLFRYAKKRGLVEKNPVKAIERYKEDPFIKYVPPADDIQAVMDVADKLQRNVITFIYNTLARAGEVRECKWSDIDFDADTITLWTSKTRDGNPAADTIEMTGALRQLLESLPKDSDYVFTRFGEPLKKYWMNDFMPKLCKKAKVKPFTPHSIRHHVAALLCYKLSLIEISKILRHRNLTTTDIYLRSLVKIETKGIKVLDDLNKPTPDNVVSFFTASNGQIF